jgi:hypothetical protein
MAGQCAKVETDRRKVIFKPAMEDQLACMRVKQLTIHAGCPRVAPDEVRMVRCCHVRIESGILTSDARIQLDGVFEIPRHLRVESVS